MVQNTILPDDPRLTAYALNEMETAERAEFEKCLQLDAAARQAVEEIRATIASLTTALAEEPLPTAIKHDLAQAAILPGMDPRKLDGGSSLTTSLSKRIKFPQFYFMVSGLAAACFAAFFVYWQENQPTHERKRYIEVPLVAAKQKSALETDQRAEEEGAKATADGGVAPKDQPAAPSVAVTFAAPAAPIDAPISDAQPLPTQGPSLVAQSREINENASKGRSDSGAAEKQEAKTRRYIQATAQSASLRSLPYGVGMALLRRERDPNTETYGFHKDNDYLRVADHPLSTFSVDVDSASYANVRRFLQQGQRPPVDAVRIEELVNYFPYDYAGPRRLDSHGEVSGAPFAAQLEVADAPWATQHRLVRIGLKGREVSEASRPAANLVFLLDVSGSMNEPNKLPLVKQSLRMLVEKLRPDDRVAIAVYAGASGLALPSTPATRKTEILDAIDRLQAEGSTNGAMGIQLAYDIAKANFISGGVNRVILATDGDFNVGVTGEGELVRLIAEKARSGVFLSVLGFGMGNLKDGTLEQLADKGNGNYAYIDSLAEAKKTLVEQAGGTLVTIAKDVKLQVEFNPAIVQAYRLIGYENRLLAKEDFNNDKVDAGEIGAGHTVTALYEIVPAGAEMPDATPAVDALKYQVPENRKSKIGNQKSGEMLTVKIRYKDPAGDVSNKLEFPLYDNGEHFGDATQDFKFASAVAAFGMLLRDSPHKGSTTLSTIADWGRAGLGSDAGGYRNEFLGLVERSKILLR